MLYINSVIILKVYFKIPKKQTNKTQISMSAHCGETVEYQRYRETVKSNQRKNKVSQGATSKPITTRLLGDNSRCLKTM